MIKWGQYPFVRVTLALITGILLALQTEMLQLPAAWLFLFSCIGFAFLFMGAKFRQSAFLFSVAGVWGMVCFGLFGWAVTQQRTEKNNGTHLLHQPGKVTHYIGYLNDFMLQKPTNYQTTIRVQKVRINNQWFPADGQVQLSIRKEAGRRVPAYGDVLLIKGEPRAVSAPLNPGQFDYRKYLAAHNIHHQQYLYPGQFRKIGENIRNPALALSIKLRHNLDKVFRKLVPSHREYGIASALVLGIKDELDNDIKATYSNTGTMHVLAVSGLHVGLVFSILSIGLKRLRSSVSHRLFSAVVALAVVWTYAFITALSPSVLRAAVMFTFVIGAQVLQRRSNMYNTLATAAFGLLCFNPYFLFDVGFQLSFLAVLAIVYLHPRIYKLLEFDNYAADQVWILTSISLAAQIGTFPLSLYYFHQFPVYFLLSNLVAVPLSTGILYVGLSVLFFGWIPYLGFGLGKLMQGMVWLMNEAMMWLEKLPYALINRIPFSGLQAVLFYAFIFLLLVFLARPKLKFLGFACALLAVFSFSHLNDAYSRGQNRKLLILAVPKQSVMAFLDGKATVFADSAFMENKQARNFSLEPVLLAAGVNSVTLQSWQNQKVQNLALKHVNGQHLFVWQA